MGLMQTRFMQNKINQIAKLGILKFRCQICHLECANYTEMQYHTKNTHQELCDKYKTIEDYEKAVKEGKEKNLKEMNK